MKKVIFLSHNAKDKELAEVISDILSQISIRQVKVWFSSDGKVDGGLNAGDNWYDEIHNKVDESDVLIALVTPNSIDRPWLYYEAGVAIGLNKKVVPICVGFSAGDIKSPLREKQAYQLTDKNAFISFLGKVLTLFDFHFDKTNFKKAIDKAGVKISSYKFSKSSEKEIGIENAIDNIKSHFDEKIKLISNSNNPNKIVKLPSEKFSVKFITQFPQVKREFIIEINDEDSFQGVTDKIYFNLNDIIKPYTYLETWVIVDNRTKNYLVIREIARRIPAKYIFLKNTSYTIKKLQKPYQSIDSKKRL